MMVQQNLILILLLWCSGAEAPFKILLRWNSACIYLHLDDNFEEILGKACDIKPGVLGPLAELGAQRVVAAAEDRLDHHVLDLDTGSLRLLEV